MSLLVSDPTIIKVQKDGSYFAIPATDDLFNKRVLFLEGEITQASCMRVIKGMLSLEQEDPEAEITLLISSPGGSVYDGLALIGVMRDISCPVHTVGMGLVASMASVILACGDRRSLYSSGYVLIHQLMGGTGMAQQSDIEISAQQASNLRHKLDELLAERSELTPEKFHELTERDCWCDAERTLELGLVDEVIA